MGPAEATPVSQSIWKSVLVARLPGKSKRMSSRAEHPYPNEIRTQVNVATSVHAVSPRVTAGPKGFSFEQIVTAVEVIGDFVAAALGLVLAYQLYRWLGLGKDVSYSQTAVVAASAVYGFLFVLLLDREGAYRNGPGLLQIRSTERLLRVSVQSFLVLLPVVVFTAHAVSRWVLVIALLLVPLLVFIHKQLFEFGVSQLHAQGWGIRKAIIYGAGYTGKRIFSVVSRDRRLGIQPIMVVDDDYLRVGPEFFTCDYRRERGAPVIGGPVDARLIRDMGAKLVLIAIPSLGSEKFSAVAHAAREAGATLAYVASNQSISSDEWIDQMDLDGILLSSIGAPQSKFFYEQLKRLLDISISILIIGLISPMLLAVALAIRFDSKGPVIFRQRRVGKGGRLFNMYKFRSMHVDAPKYGYSPTEAMDPRITRVGRFIRRTSMDELPQLFNVLRGDMSLVGPRPEQPFIVEGYGVRERQRLCVLPGITGLWQLSADRAFLIHENLQYDLYYIRHRGFFLDLSILAHTALFAMRGV
jgi:exopolysaccharide biosynthesis polyprenyl glycosylphosphotransferase